MSLPDWTPLALADTAADAAQAPRRPRYGEAIPREHTTNETLLYLGVLYVTSTALYLHISANEVFNNASLQNYATNFLNISIFDQDLPSANWGVHLLTGSMTYEFYRARSYSKIDSFLLTLAQECLFQFTVETLLFPTGFENVINTAVVGSIIGRGFEVASIPMMNSDFFLFRIVGHILNPTTLIGLYENRVAVAPIAGPGMAGAELRMEF